MFTEMVIYGKDFMVPYARLITIPTGGKTGNAETVGFAFPMWQSHGKAKPSLHCS